MPLNLGNIITRAASYWADNIGVIDEDRRIAYCAFEKRTNRLSTEETVHVANDGKPEVFSAGPEHTRALAAHRDEMETVKYPVGFGTDAGDMIYEELLERGTPTHDHAQPDDDATAVLHYFSGSSGVRCRPMARAKPAPSLPS